MFKDEVLSKYKKIMSKLHPDRNDTDTTKLSSNGIRGKRNYFKK